MTQSSSTLLSIDNAVARVTLNRPEVHNAFDDALIAELTDVFARVGQDVGARAVVLAATGKSFSAGADLNWMRRTAEYDFDRNVEDARNMALMLSALNTLPKPTLALVQGAAFGGGVGLVVAVDIAIASEKASFRLSEVALGLVPATISPYVMAAIGTRAARRYFLTAERFGAAEALRLGMVHAVVAPDELDAEGGRVIEALKGNGPEAVADAKRLIADVAGRPVDEVVIDETARRIAAVRAGEEGKEGVRAFLEKRTPAWREG